MTKILNKLEIKGCERARLSRDPKFDGLFFTAVKTTGIYCRSICPATAPKVENVEYYRVALSAAAAGYRPCLRCRPDSAPSSNAWVGNDTTLIRAIRLIDNDDGSIESIEHLSERLGISSRYLRKLFAQKLGTSPQKYLVYQRVLLAKKLLHETSLPISTIAFASGFGTVRSFNHSIKANLALTPSDIRKQKRGARSTGSSVSLKLHYRPPFDWDSMLSFLQTRVVDGIEWVQSGKYGRTIITQTGARGFFEVHHDSREPILQLELALEDFSDIHALIKKIRRLFDLDAPMSDIEACIQQVLGSEIQLAEGLRIPGVWDPFEAGIRAVLGQQVTVQQAHKLVNLLVKELGQSLECGNRLDLKLFPSPKTIAKSDLAFLKMPQARKDTIHRLAKHFIENDKPAELDEWLGIKGIGPWTVNYVKLRAAKDTDVWLSGDAGVNNALKLVGSNLDPDAASPWRSYLVFQLWHRL